MRALHLNTKTDTSGTATESKALYPNHQCSGQSMTTCPELQKASLPYEATITAASLSVCVLANETTANR